MSRDATRGVVFRFCMSAVLVLAALFAWAALLTYAPTDPLNASVYPREEATTNWCGRYGALLAYSALYYLGGGAHVLLLLLTAGAFSLVRQQRYSDWWLRGLGGALVTAAASTACTFLLDFSGYFPLGRSGGVLGTVILAELQPLIGTTGLGLLLITAGLVGLLLAADDLILALFRGAKKAAPGVGSLASAVSTAGAAVGGALATVAASIGNRSDTVEVPAAAGGNGRKRAAKAEQLALELDEDEPEEEEVDDEEEYEEDADEAPEDDEEESEYEEEDEEEADEEEDAEPEPAVPDEERIAATVRALGGRRQERDATPYYRPPDDQGYTVPGVELLEHAIPIDRAEIERLCREKALILEQTLNEFRVDVQVVAIDTGPVITVFELRLAAGVKVNQISALTNDMARALGAPAVRVVSPLPGKNTIGIEVPNIDKEKVRISDVINGVAAKLSKFELPLFLGKDASGAPLVADLTRMPHLLIAGTTGSGKSVCISSIVMSVLMTRTPSEVNMILVDPKVVELTMFKDVPHLMCPIISDMGRAEAILEWAGTKMDERYALLAEAGVKDIRGYNALGEEGLRERFQPTDEDEFQRIPRRLPYIVIIIDELADLMMTSAKEVEFYLCRLAQKSRAVGIHLIVSTQRPSANVVTGLIKSNLPCRIAFRVASRLDSRIVLDQNGGEVLMGQGDMLYLPPGSSKLVRAQGTFIDDSELRAVVNHTRSQCEQRFHPELTRTPNVGADSDGERDELFDQAVEVIVEAGRGSVSLLQRRLTVGYGRAARLIEQMHAAGIVGDYKSGQAREVVVTKDEWAAIKAQRDREEADESARA